MLKANFQTKASQKFSHVSGSKQEKNRNVRFHSTSHSSHKETHMTECLLSEKASMFSLSKAMCCGEGEWRFKETICGNHYGAHSKGVAGQGKTMQDREAGYNSGN